MSAQLALLHSDQASLVLECRNDGPPLWRHLGARVEPACPDFTGANDAFQALRGQVFAVGYEAALKSYASVQKLSLFNFIN